MAVIESKAVTLKNGQKACIRNRTNKDAEKATQCIEAVFADDRFFLTTLDELKQQLTVEKYIERTKLFNEHEQNLLLITETDGQIVSMSDVECGNKTRNRHVGQIGISILPEYRGIGLGTAIMETMINWATAHPVIEKLALGVWSRNTPAIGLYKKMGFIEEGRKVREVKYTDGAYDDCILMYRFVRSI